MKKTMALLTVCIFLCISTSVVYATDLESFETNENGQDLERKGPEEYTAPLLEYPGVKVIESSDAIPFQYSFMPNVAESTAEMFGGGSEFQDHYIFVMRNIEKGSSGMLYHNVGSYKGIQLDMRVTIVDWEVGSSFLLLWKNRLDIEVSERSGVKLNYTYLKAGTDTPVSVAGYHNFNDIDMEQYIRIFDDMNVQQIYCAPNNALHYNTGADYLEVGEVNGISSEDNSDKSIWLNYTYDETASFSILFGTRVQSAFIYTYEALVPITKPVTVKYTDISGAEIAPADTIGGAIGETYHVTAKTIDGYTLETTPNNATGTFSEAEQTVIFVYKAIPTETPKPEGAVQVLYVDEEEQELAESDTLRGAIGEAYTAKPKEIEGYTCLDEPENAKGTYTAKEQTVVFVYEKSTGKVIVRYVDEDGKEIADALTLGGTLREAYETNAKRISGYTLVETPKNYKGIYQKDTQEVIYKYKRITTARTSTSVTRKTSPKTGDSFGDMLWVYGVISLVSITAVCLLLYRRRVKNR